MIIQNNLHPVAANIFVPKMEFLKARIPMCDEKQKTMKKKSFKFFIFLFIDFSTSLFFGCKEANGLNLLLSY